MTRIHESAYRTMVLTAGLVALASCGGDSSTAPEPPRATAISISPPSATLEFIGATETFTAAITDQNGAAFAGAVAWSSEQPGGLHGERHGCRHGGVERVGHGPG